MKKGSTFRHKVAILLFFLAFLLLLAGNNTAIYSETEKSSGENAANFHILSLTYHQTRGKWIFE